MPPLTPLDMAASKLLANSDRWPDDGVFSRDLIDLAMMKPSLALLRQAVAKAEGACGAAVRRDLQRAIDRMQARTGWLERCDRHAGAGAAAHSGVEAGAHLSCADASTGAVEAMAASSCGSRAAACFAPAL